MAYRIIIAAIAGGYGTLLVADPLAAALRPAFGFDAPFLAVAGAPLILVIPALVVCALSRPRG